MKEKAQSIVKRQFTILSRQDDFLSIPPQLLCTILGYDDLNLGIIKLLHCNAKLREYTLFYKLMTKGATTSR